MKILHLAPELEDCGAKALAVDLACRLQQEGLTENVLVSPAGTMEERIGQASLPHRDCPKPGIWNFVGGTGRQHKTLQQVQPDIVLAYGARAAWEAGRALQKHPLAKRPKLVGVLATYPHIGTTARGLVYCDAFTAVSRHLREVLEQFSPVVGDKGAWAIPYGVQERQCYPTYGPSEAWLRTWNAKYPNHRKQMTLCVPGAIPPLHGHGDLIPLLRALHLSGVFPRILIAGDEQKADSSYLEELRKRFDEAELGNDIFWIGAREDMRDVFCVSDAVLSLNREPAAADRAILEALALGCPVVGYDHGVVGEMLTSFLPEGRIAPCKTDAMADTLFQWSVYPPTTVEEIPYPYRMADTVENYMTLFHSLLDTEHEFPTARTRRTTI